MGPKYPDKRSFRRQRADLDFDLVISGRPFRAKVVDFSLDGLGILILDPAFPKSSVVHVNIDDIDINAVGEMRWSRTIPGGVRAGIRTTGPIKGKLDRHRLSDVLFGLKRTGKSGVLEVVAGSVVSRIFLRRGELILPASRQGQYGVADFLLESGNITPEQHKKSLEVAEKTGKRQSTVLVELGYITASELAEGVRNEAETAMLDLLTTGKGQFVFRDGALVEDEVVALKFDLESLVYRALRKTEDAERIRSGCPAGDSVLFFVANPSPVVKRGLLDERDRKVLSLVNGDRTVREIISLSPLSEFETIRSIYVLRHLQLIDAENRGGDASGSPEAALDPVFAERLERLYTNCQSLDYYGVLEVGKNASADEIKRAYHRMAKEFHPDRYLHVEADYVKEKLHAIFSSISKAYRELTGPGSRNPVTSAEEVSRGGYNTNLASERFKEGKRLFSSGNFEQAATLFGQAVYLNDSNPEYCYFYALALLKNKKMKPAEESLKKASQLDPFNSKYISELGCMYLELGFKTRAKGAFEKALKFNPSDERAQEGMKKLAPQK